MANFLTGLADVLGSAAAGGTDPGGIRRGEFQQEMQAKQQAARVGAAQMVLQNPNAPEAAVLAATGVLEKAGMGGMAAGLRPGPAGPEFKNVPATSRVVSFPPGGGAPEEVLPAAGGTAGTAASRNRREKIADNMRLTPGLTERQAMDIVDKNKQLSAPDPFGNVWAWSRVPGEPPELVAGPSKVSAGAQPARPPAPRPPGMSPQEAAGKGTGPVAATLQGVSNLIGFMFSGQITPETTDARQTLDLFNKTFETAIIKNPKFPVREIEFVQGLLPSTRQFFKNPNDSVENVRKLDFWSQTQLIFKQEELNAPGITTKRKAQLSNEISALREIRKVFPDPTRDFGRFADMSFEMLESVDRSQLTEDEKRLYLNAIRAAR